MPKKLERRLVREYRAKGYSLKRSRGITFATMNKMGLLHPKRRKRHGKRRHR